MRAQTLTRRFLIYVPWLNVRSNGVSLLYELALLLDQVGEAVALVCYDGEPYSQAGTAVMRYRRIPCFRWKVDFGLSQVQPEDIAVYSETIIGSPLQTKRTVRYLMNIPGLLVPTAIHYHPSDFLVSYSLGVDSELPQLFILKNHEFHLGPVQKKDQVAVHFGKTNLSSLRGRIAKAKSVVKRFSAVEIITRKYPQDREELVKILTESKLLISFDPLSNIHYEATLLGTPVWVADDSVHQTSRSFNIPLPGIYYDSGSDFMAFSPSEVVQIYLSQVREGNREAVCSFLDNLEEHFNRWELDPTYRSDREYQLAAANCRWERIHGSEGRYELNNIDEPWQIPERVLYWLDKELYIVRFRKQARTLFKRILTAEVLRFGLRDLFSGTRGYAQLKRLFLAAKKITTAFCQK